MSSLQEKNSRIIKEEAAILGFSFCGISKAEFLEEEAPRLEEWLKQGRHGKMNWMENHFDLRLDPRMLVPEAKSVVSLMYNYYSEAQNSDPSAPKISKYAYGRDYHKVIKRKLKALLATVREKIGDINGRAFVDSAPVMERAWAAKSGLGWTGKHTLLINKGHGSYYFLAEIIIDLELEPDDPVKDYCGSCTACIDACPTEAITPYGLKADQCISYLTIELKEQIPEPLNGKLDNWVFGCDICQEVCPWNRFAKQHQEPEFKPHDSLLNMSAKDWEEISEEVFGELFDHTPVKRAGLKKVKQTLRDIMKK